MIGRCLTSAVLVSVVVAAGCLPSDEAFEESQSTPILGGELTSDYPTVVALVGQGLCTGILVAPDVVMTAAHCLSAASQVVFKSESIQPLSSEARVVRVQEYFGHPGWAGQPGSPDDFGLLRLEEPVTDIQPSPFNLDPTLAPAGITVTMVGYGQIDNGSIGTKYVLEDKRTVRCSQFGFSDGSFLCFSQFDGTGKCSGDSGGPSFANINGVQTLVGITSFGDRFCQEYGADVRVDAHLDFIEERMPDLLCASNGVCGEGCGVGGVPEDPDCNPCVDSGDCESVDVCSAGGACIPGPESPGGIGAICGDGLAQCGSGLCIDGGEENRCSIVCTGGDSCPDGFDCIQTELGSACWPGDEESGQGAGCRSSGGLSWLLLTASLVLVLRQRRSPA